MKTSLKILPTDALILVDVQKDFLPDGALGVPNGDKILPVLNKATELFHQAHCPIYASRDWHPANHCSFVEQNGPWPSHCVQETAGAEFAEVLHLPKETIVISKADTPSKDAYSAFQETALTDMLSRAGIKRIIVAGLATDYCVKATVLDARKAGFDVLVIEDGIAAVNINPQDGAQAIKDMQNAGAQFISL